MSVLNYGTSYGLCSNVVAKVRTIYVYDPPLYAYYYYY
jgi:hypothetical protein